MTDLKERLERVSTPHICDAMARLGIANTVMHGLRPVSEPGLVLAGRAATLELVPARERSDPRRLGPFLDQVVERGDAVVIAAHGHCEHVCVGGRAALTAQMRGASGIIVDGGVRDLPELRGKGFPIFAAGHGLHASEGYLEGIRTNEPVLCGGVKVEAGDWLVGDDSGVVVIPSARVDEILGLAEEREEVDRESMVDLARDGNLAATHRHFRDDDTEWMSSVE